MSKRRRRESTVVESGFGGSPPPAGFRESTHVESSTPQSDQGWGNIGNSPAAPAPQGRRRDATVVDEPIPRVPEQDKDGNSSTVHPGTSGRRIAGWLLSEDAFQSHALRAGTNLIGRGPDNDIILDNPKVSGLQCNIICEESETLLMPRPEARNPTSVNENRIYTTTVIPDHSTISFAGSVFVYVPAPWRQHNNEQHD